jgi:hypothetical protein
MYNGRLIILNKVIEGLHQKPMILCGILLIATLLLYAPVAHHDFIGLDDNLYITENAHVRTGLNLANIDWAFTHSYLGNWNPVAWISHMTDCQLFGLKPGPHHCVNLLLHAANVLLLFTLLRLATGAVWRSFFVAVLFAVHPLNVETVAWVAERKSLLSAFFSLLTVAAYGWYAKHPGLQRYLAITAAFALALMSKPMAVTLPVVLLLVDYWPMQRFEELRFAQRLVRLVPEKLPLLLMSAASAYMTISPQRANGTLTSLSAVPLRVRLESAAHSYLIYIGKLFWPAKLAVLYPATADNMGSLPLMQVVTSISILIGITAAALFLYRMRYFLTGWLSFLVVLLPVIGIVQFHQLAIADRFTYVPFIGLFVVGVWGVSDVAEKAKIDHLIPAIAALGVAVVLTVASSRYLQYWQNEVTLLTRAHNLASRPDSVIEGALADGLKAAGRTDEALGHYQQACALDSNDPLCHYNIGQILFHRNQFDQAIAECHDAARLTNIITVPLSVNCLVQSGILMANMGNFEAADREFAAALNFDPGNQPALQFREWNLRRMRGAGR